MDSLITHVISWPVFVIALLVFGFAPGAVLRLIVLLFRRDDPRRRELLGELYAVPRIERPFWVIEQLEVGLFEGLRGRFARRSFHDRDVAIDRAGEQGLLFREGLIAHPGNVGYRGPTACATAGITYRQLDYWARTALVEPSVRPAHGSGSKGNWLYSSRDILALKVIKRLLDTGVTLQDVRAAVNHLRDSGTKDLAEVTLISDGVGVYECTPDMVVDLLAGGQGVFGIALGRIWQEVDRTLAELPAEPGDEPEE
jgi:DNA-binding transcriptional MerR regulator